MKFYLSVLGGGSQTEIICFNEDCQILSIGTSGGANSLYDSYQNVMANISDALAECVQRLYNYGFKGELEVVYGGILTTDSGSDLKKCIDSIGFTVNKYVQIHEPYCYLLGASYSNRGCFALSGTGSIVGYYRSPEDFICVGGYGVPIGDDGSSSWIGIKGLNAVTRAANGWGEKTILSELLYEGIDKNNRVSIFDMLVSSKEALSENKRYMYVSFSKKVIYGAKLQDKVCVEILKEAAQIMGMQTLAAVSMYYKGYRGYSRQMYYPEQGLLEVSSEMFPEKCIYTCGRSWENNPIMQSAFEEYVSSRIPFVECIEAKYKAVYAGLVLYSMQNNMMDVGKRELDKFININ